MSLESAIQDLVRQTVLEIVGESPPEPVLITVEQAAQLGGDVDRSVIDALVHGAPANGFPATKLGARTIKINRQKYIQWLNAGGLNGVN